MRDGERDSVDCGWGQDVVYADAVDTVAANCETVIRSGPSGAGPGAPSSGGTPSSAGRPSTGGKPGARPSRRCIVPRVTGLRVSVARRRIAAAGCRSTTVGHGRIVRRQSIRHGKAVPRGTRVTLRT